MSLTPIPSVPAITPQVVGYHGVNPCAPIPQMDMQNQSLMALANQFSQLMKPQLDDKDDSESEEG